jgi:hypothetical protein
MVDSVDMQIRPPVNTLSPSTTAGELRLSHRAPPGGRSPPCATSYTPPNSMQVIALGQVGWSLRRNGAETGIRRKTIGSYLRAAGVAVGRRERPTTMSPSASSWPRMLARLPTETPARSYEALVVPLRKPVLLRFPATCVLVPRPGSLKDRIARDPGPRTSRRSPSHPQMHVCGIGRRSRADHPANGSPDRARRSAGGDGDMGQRAGTAGGSGCRATRGIDPLPA